MLKPNSEAAKGTGKLAADDALALKELPNLRGFFLDQTYGADESPREPGVMIIRACKDGWAFTLKEPTSCLMLRILGRTWDESLLMADAALGDPKAPWETDPYEVNRRAKSRRRGS